MSELGNAQVSFNNALGLYKNNNLKEAIEQLNEILNIESSHKKSLDLMVHIYIKIISNNAFKKIFLIFNIPEKVKFEFGFLCKAKLNATTGRQ